MRIAFRMKFSFSCMNFILRLYNCHYILRNACNYRIGAPSRFYWRGARARSSHVPAATPRHGAAAPHRDASRRIATPRRKLVSVVRRSVLRSTTKTRPRSSSVFASLRIRDSVSRAANEHTERCVRKCADWRGSRRRAILSITRARVSTAVCICVYTCTCIHHT